MLKNIIDLLSLDDYYGKSERIEIAKGRYEFPTTTSSTIHYIKRVWYGSRKG
jgi:hypothetical protein